MSDAKGVEKFAEEFVIGVIDFIYSAAATAIVIIARPIRGPARFRALSHPEVRPLSAPVAMFLSYLGLVLYVSPEFQRDSPGNLTEFVKIFSGLQWYQKLAVVSVLFVISDLIVRIACRLFARSKHHYYRDCDRLRYAIAASAIVLMIALSLFALADVFPAYVDAVSDLGGIVLTVGPTCLLVIVLGSIVRGRFRPRRSGAIALAYLCAIPLIWVGAGAAFAAAFAMYKTLDDAIRPQSSQPVLLPPQARRVDASRLLCLVEPDGHVAVSALLRNDSDTIALFAPDEFSLALAHEPPRSPRPFAPLTSPVPSSSAVPRSSPPERLVSFPLDAGTGFAISIPPHQAKLTTFTLSLAANSLPWPLDGTQWCRLDRTPEYALDRELEFESNGGMARVAH